MEPVDQWPAFARLFLRATAAVAQQYFYLPQYQGPTVYRERTYCYELYHQVRLLMDAELPPDYPCLFNGELDKRGNIHFCQRYDGEPKPDFLLHRPGDWEGNIAVVEVKPARAPAADLKADLQKLAQFVELADYRRGVLLVFGAEAEECVGDLRPRLPEVTILLHTSPGEMAFPIVNGEEWT